MKSHDPQTPDPFWWTAHRYVLGEMTAEESAAYETLLANDAEVCAAVAEAVELIEAIRQVRPERAPAQRRRLRLAGLVAAAATLGSIGAALWGMRASRTAIDAPAAVALLWSDLHESPGPFPTADAELVELAETEESEPSSWMAELAVLAPESEPIRADPEPRGG